MYASNVKRQTPTKITWDLGDTLVRIKSKKLQEGAVRASIAFGFPVSRYQIEEEIRNEWGLRKDSYHLEEISQIDSDKKETDYWISGFYLSLFRRISGQTIIPLPLLKFFCKLQMEPENFELIPYASIVMDAFKIMGIDQGLLSNAFPSANRIIKYHKLDRCLKFTILSYECKLAKPDPEIYQLLVEKFNLTDGEQIVYVDDRLEFLRIPRQLSILPVWFNNRFCPKAVWTGSCVNTLKELLELFLPLYKNKSSNQQPVLQYYLFP